MKKILRKKKKKKNPADSESFKKYFEAPIDEKHFRSFEGVP